MENNHDQWHQDPGNWKLGILYFNKEDSRLLLPKRNKKMGWTINFANPITYLIFAALIAGNLILVFAVMGF